MRWPIVLGVTCLGAVAYFLLRPSLTLEVAATGVIHPIDHIVVRCEGARYTVLLRVNPDRTIDVIDGREGDFSSETICPVVDVPGKTRFVALAFSRPVDIDSPKWRRRLSDVDVAQSPNQWKQQMHCRQVRIREFETSVELRPIDASKLERALKVYIAFCKQRISQGDFTTLERVGQHIIEQTRDVKASYSHEEAKAISWLLIVGERPDLALQILDDATTDNDEQEAFQQVMQAMCKLYLDDYQGATSSLESARELSESRELDEYALALWSVGQLALGRPDHVIDQLSPLFGGKYAFCGNESKNLILERLIQALEELGRISEIRVLVNSLKTMPASYDWLVLFGDYEEATTVAKSTWVSNPALGLQPLATDWAVSGIVGPDVEWRPSTIGFLDANTKISNASFFVQRSRHREAGQLVSEALNFFETIDYEGVRYADAKLLLSRCAICTGDLNRATALSLDCLDQERKAVYRHPHREAEAEWSYALVLAAKGSHECIAHLDRAVELTSHSGLLNSGRLAAKAHHLAAHFEQSPQAKQRRLDMGLDIAAREMVRWDRPRSTADMSLVALWQYLSASRLSPKETYQRIRPFAARTLDGSEPWRRPDAALVDLFFYYHTDTHFELPQADRQPKYVAFIRHEDEVERVELGDSMPIDRAVWSWRQKMSNYQDPREAAQTVRKVLWRPLHEHIPPAVKTLYICGDWEMAAVPWEAIPLEGTDNGRQVIERWHVERLPASRSKRLTKALQLAVGEELGVELPQQVSVARPAWTPSQGRWVLVGDVDFGAEPEGLSEPLRGGDDPNAPRFPWQPLQATAREIELIQAQADRPCDVLRGAEATKAAVVQLLPEAEIAHFATHAFANADWHRLSPVETGGVSDHFGLALAGANQSAADGLLTATEVSKLTMPHLKLAVLSGCETGVGRPVRDQFFSTLHRAFHTAGAKQVLASLWRVNDDAAQQMMTRFYKHYLPGKVSASQALRAAQLEIRALGKDGIAMASRGPDFSKGPQPVMGGTLRRRSPDQVWAGWYVSSLVFENQTIGLAHEN